MENKGKILVRGSNYKNFCHSNLALNCKTKSVLFFQINELKRLIIHHVYADLRNISSETLAILIDRLQITAVQKVKIVPSVMRVLCIFHSINTVFMTIWSANMVSYLRFVKAMTTSSVYCCCCGGVTVMMVAAVRYPKHKH